MADCDLRAIQEFFIVCEPHYKPGKIVLPFRIESGHFSGLSPDERALGFKASRCNPLNDNLGLFNIQLPHRQIIQEKKRGGSLHHNVVYAHGNKINTHGVVFVQHECYLQLCAYTICGGDEHWVLGVLHIQRKKPSKTSYICDDT